MLRPFIPLLLAAALAGCATFDDRELAGFRAQRVTPPVYSKLSRGEPVEPSDVIELSRRGVATPLIIRQIEDHGVGSVVTRSDVVALRRAGVSPPVIDSLLRASDDFASDYSDRGAVVAYDPLYDLYDPWPVHGSVGLGFSTGRDYGGRRGYHRHR